MDTALMSWPGGAFAEDGDEPKPFAGLRLSARQRRLYERLVDLRQPVGTSLGEMYLGALVALASSTPDALAHAAHSSRELIEKLWRVPENDNSDESGPHPSGVGKELQDAWGAYRRNRGIRVVELLGQTVDGELLAVLLRLEQFREAGLGLERGRKSKIRRGMRELAFGDMELPASVREQDVKHVQKLWGYFDKASHHGSALADPERLRERLQQLEDFLMRLVPETFADMEELDAIIGGGDA